MSETIPLAAGYEDNNNNNESGHQQHYQQEQHHQDQQQEEEGAVYDSDAGVPASPSTEDDNEHLYRRPNSPYNATEEKSDFVERERDPEVAAEPRERKPSVESTSSPVYRKKSRKQRKSRKRRRYHSSCSTCSSRFSRSPDRRSRRKRVPSRSSSGSSRGTYEGFEFILEEKDAPFGCKQCHIGFYTMREQADHEAKNHDGQFACYHCDKVAVSVVKLAAHMLFRHASKAAVCIYCNTTMHEKCQDMDRKQWDEFRSHMIKETVKIKMAQHYNRLNHNESGPLRGVGGCPHGAPVRCKNFPSCPGAKCIYSHGACRYDITCNKSTCPFDHTNRPRTCMTCLTDHKPRRRF